MASPPQRCFKFPYDEHVDKPNDTRNILLIVATLIIAVTFQAGVNPPGGVWQETTNCPNETCLDETGVNPPGGVRLENTNCTNCLNETGVNPPGGVWQENTNCTNCLNETAICKPKCRKAGTAIYASQPVAFHIFLASNTLALTSSSLVMFCLTYKFPFFLELWVAILGMLLTYGSAIFAISPEESVRFGALLGAAALPFALKFLVYIYKMS